MNTTYAHAASQGIVAPAEAEREDVDVAEVVVAWQSGYDVASRNILAVRHLEAGQALVCGEEPGCDASLPASALGAETRALVRFDGALAHVEIPEGARTSIDGFFSEVTGSIDVKSGQHVELLLPTGEAAFVVSVRVAAAGRSSPLSLGEAVRGAGLGGVGVSALVHGLLFASLAFFVPALSENDAEAMERDNLVTMRRYLDASAEKELERQMDQAGGEAGPNADGQAAASGEQAKGPEGRMGKQDLKGDGRWSAPGDAKPHEVTLPREQELAIAKNFGMVGLLATSNDANVPVVPWGSVLNGADKDAHAGNFWGADPGESWGSGLGLSGPGEGGGGLGEGIGMNGISGLGGMGPGGPGFGGNGGIGGCPPGRRCGPGVGGGHVVRGPQMRMPKDFETNGKLAPEVIQRIVRLNAGRYRSCYESALRTNPSLTGRVQVRFVIDRSGAVSVANDGDSTLPDGEVRACVVRAFTSLSFPQPQGGTVTVVYPIYFVPE